MAVQNSQHHNRVTSDEVEHAMFENGKIYSADVGKTNRIQSGMGRKINKTLVSLGKKTVVKTSLLSAIPFSAVGKVGFNERMKVERQHFCESD